MKRQTLLMLGILTLISLYCSKKGVFHQSTSNEKLPSLKYTTITSRHGGESQCEEPNNPDNGWDSIGIYHNLAINYVKDQSGGNSLSISEAVGYSNDYISNTFGTPGSNISSFLPSSSFISGPLSVR